VTRNEKIIVAVALLFVTGLITLVRFSYVPKAILAVSQPQHSAVRWNWATKQMQAYNRQEHRPKWECIEYDLFREVNQRITQNHCDHDMKYIGTVRKDIWIGSGNPPEDYWNAMYDFECRKCGYKQWKYEKDLDPNTLAAIKELGL